MRRAWGWGHRAKGGFTPCPQPHALRPLPQTKNTMFKQFIAKLPGADVYMVTSFLTFLVFFCLVGLYLVLVDRRHIDQVSRLPLDDTTDA